MDEKAKINPYLIVIVILIIIIAGFAYNQWGKKILPGSVENPKNGGANVELLEGDIVIGNEDAPVTIVEYYGYLCGYCELFHEQTYPKILKDYITTGKVRYVFRPFPPYELSTAILCANEQDKFFAYHELLFKSAADIETIDDLKELTGEVNLNIDEFNQCFDSQKYLDKAQEWYQQGQDDFEKAGVPTNQRGTPAFFVNGEPIIGAQPYEIFVDVIEGELGE